MVDPLPPPPSSSGGDDGDPFGTWYGNIDYLLNISAIGSACCLLIFLLVKLRSDHRRMPGPAALASKLLAVWHATGREIARHCGADAAQFLLIEGGSFALLLSLAALALTVLLPLNLSAGTAPLADGFSKTTITHIPKGSPLLWIHFLFAVLVAVLVHFGISATEERLRITRFRDGYGNLSDPTVNSTAIFTIMVQGLPKIIGADRIVLHEYFQYRYPGKVYKVIVPMDLCALDDLANELLRVRDEISWLVARIDSRLLPEDGDGGGNVQESRVIESVLVIKERVPPVWCRICYNERGGGWQFFSVMELRLRRNQWKVERAPLATDIYWKNMGTPRMSLKLRRVFVNTCLLLMLLFFSSPLAVISAVKSAGRIINAEAMDNAQLWLAWVQSSSWLASLIFQFLPNMIIFVSMYIVIPSALSYLSKFERHLTVSGEQRAALMKMVCFFLVNLILLRGLVESSLESMILKMGRCYLDGEDCKRIEQYMSASILSKSCLSSLAFLITSTFLGISYDLLAPIPWIKRNIQKFRKNDMLQLVPEQSEEYPLENQGIDNQNSLQRPLMHDNAYDIANGDNVEGQDLFVYPITGSSPAPKQTFDFAQYYAFNLTIFALTLVYCSFNPLVVPVGAVYFGYRYVVDKYNFLFVYRVRGFPAGNDGRLIDTVICIMRFCVDLFLLAMLLFFSVQGDSTKLQAIFTLGLLVMYKLLPSSNDSFQSTLLEDIQTVDNVVDTRPIDYEVFSQPRFDWDTPQR
uniref:CSC1/OSCA1-like 7TM region domain-containing protein n=1 Tax=Glycine max TaxID=3847 RepID=A0A368UJQ0_SOYBN